MAPPSLFSLSFSAFAGGITLFASFVKATEGEWMWAASFACFTLANGIGWALNYVIVQRRLREQR
jgi:hypothetical protein